VIAGLVLSASWYTFAQSVESFTTTAQHTQVWIPDNLSVDTLSGCVAQLFRVSWYYSPQPNQDVYTRNTYEAEIRLNGRGTHWASGRGVFNGMVAAPRSYPFGTKIVLPWLWVGEVHDRWSAIVSGDGFDRIDVRLGAGDVGIERAKAVWLKWILWWRCDSNVTLPIWFDWSRIPDYVDFVGVAFWSVDQSIGRSGALVYRLQFYLKQLWYDSSSIVSWVYDRTMSDVVCRFQVEHLQLNPDDDACGYTGPATRNALRRLLIRQWLLNDAGVYALHNQWSISSLFTQPDVRPWWVSPVTTIAPAVIASGTQGISWDTTLNFAATRFVTSRMPRFGQQNTNVIVLQKILQREWIFRQQPTWYFGPITRDAVIQFQLKYNLIDDVSHSAAGVIGPTTRRLLLIKQRTLR